MFIITGYTPFSYLFPFSVHLYTIRLLHYPSFSIIRSYQALTSFHPYTVGEQDQVCFNLKLTSEIFDRFVGSWHRFCIILRSSDVKCDNITFSGPVKSDAGSMTPSPDISTKSALDSLLVSLSIDFQDKHPEANKFDWYENLRPISAENILRGNINIQAHENQSKFSSLHEFDRSLPLIELYNNEFLKKKIGGSAETGKPRDRDSLHISENRHCTLVVRLKSY